MVKVSDLLKASDLLKKSFPTERISKTQIIDSDHLILTTSRTIEAGDEYGEKGTICYDSNFVYVCVGKDTWKKVKLSPPADDLTSEDITDIQNLSGVNTGDQDLSGLVPYTGATGNVDLGVNDLNVGGNITAGYFFGDGSHLTGIPSPDLSAYWRNDGSSTATGNWDIGTYNISANSFIGNGSQLTGLSEKPFAQQGRLSLPQLTPGSYLIEEVPGWAFSGQTSSIQAVSAWLVPIYVSRGVSYRGFRYNIYSTTGKTATAYRVGIYDVDYSTGLPKNLVWDSSKQTFATTTGVKQVIGLNIPLTEGWYYIVGTKNGNINLYGSSPAQQRPPLGGFGDPSTTTILTSTTADWTDGFPNPWVNTGFDHLNTNGYAASFFKLYRNSEA